MVALKHQGGSNMNEHCNCMHQCSSECPEHMTCPLDNVSEQETEKNRAASRCRHHNRTKSQKKSTEIKEMASERTKVIKKKLKREEKKANRKHL